MRDYDTVYIVEYFESETVIAIFKTASERNNWILKNCADIDNEYRYNGCLISCYEDYYKYFKDSKSVILK